MKRESWRLGGFHFHSNRYGSYGMVTAARNGAMQEGGIHWGGRVRNGGGYDSPVLVGIG